MVAKDRFRFKGKKIYAQNERGFTLVELMIGIILLGMLAISFFTLFTTLIRSTLVIKRKAVASTLATTQMEYLKSLPFDALAIASSDITTTGTPLPSLTYATLNGTNYTIKTEITYVDDAFDGCGAYPTPALKEQYCRNYPPPASVTTDDSNRKDYKLIHITVMDKSNFTLAEADSEISARVAETISTTGALFVLVLDESGQKIPGATVRVQNSTVAPVVDQTKTTDTNGYATYYDLVPDTSGYDYVITASLAGSSSLTTIPISGTLTPTYPSQRIFTQSASYVTMILKPMTSNSLIMEATDVLNNPIANLKLYVKGGYKKYSATSDTSYYFDNAASLATTGADGQTALANLVPGPYIFCGDLGDSATCKTPSNRYYVVAAVPYNGLNSFNPVEVPSYDAIAPPTTYTYNSAQYVQKVRLYISTSVSFPRVVTLTPSTASAADGNLGTFPFVINGVNLTCSSVPASCGTTVQLLQGGNTYAASCTGENVVKTTLNCKVNLTAASNGSTQLRIIQGGNTLTIPATFSLGGINVTP